MISQSLIERKSEISNPGLGKDDVMDETARELRKLASLLHNYWYLIPMYTVMAWIFRLPFPAEILAASAALKSLADGIKKSADGVARAAPQDLDTLAKPDEQAWLSERQGYLCY
jgi:hypothetical protein